MQTPEQSPRRLCRGHDRFILPGSLEYSLRNSNVTPEPIKAENCGPPPTPKKPSRVSLVQEYELEMERIWDAFAMPRIQFKTLSRKERVDKMVKVIGDLFAAITSRGPVLDGIMEDETGSGDEEDDLDYEVEDGGAMGRYTNGEAEAYVKNYI